MTELIIDWNQISQIGWEQLLARVENSSFQQAWAYGAIFAQRSIHISRFVIYEGSEPVGMGQIVTRRFFGLIKIALLLRGPVWLREVTTAQKKQVLNKIRQRYPLKWLNFFAFSPEEDTGRENYDRENYEKMGFRKIITGYSTVLVNLGQSEDQLWRDLYGKNRTSIRKAEKAGFDVQFGDHRHAQIDWLLSHESKQQKDKKYQGLPVGLVQRYGHASLRDRGVLTAFAIKEGEEMPIAGALFLCHGNCATYHIGWNGKEGRKCNALNLLLWHVILKLKQRGIVTLDLGGVNTEEGADIARFKFGFGGRIVHLPGTFM